MLSGYLITTLLLAEWEATSSIGLRAFWRRRARRLGPPLAMTVVVVALLTPAVYPDVADRIRGELLATLALATNWFEALAGHSYFEAIGRPSPLGHLWSLAVEAQFYVVWPVVAVVVLRRGGRRALGLVALAGAVASFSAMALAVAAGHDPSRLYYGADTRAGTLLVGAVLATSWPIDAVRRLAGRRARLAVDGAGLGALAGLAVLARQLDGVSVLAYQGGLLLVALLGAVLIVVASHPDAYLGRVLGTGPLVWLGTRSYAVYLWHWPVLTATRPGTDVAIHGWALLVVRLALVAGLAELTTRITRAGLPPRRAWIPARRWQLAGAGGLLAVGVMVVVRTPGPAPAFALSPTTTLSTVLVPSTKPSAPAPSTSSSVLRPTPTVLAAAPGSVRPTVVAAVAAPGSTTTAVAAPSAAAGAPPAAPATTGVTNPAGQVRAVAVGESVLLAAGGELQRALGPGTFVDAVVGRQPDDVLDALAADRQAGRLTGATTIVVQMGTNGLVRGGQLDRLAALVGDIPRVVAVTVWVDRPWGDASNASLRAGAARYPWLRLADWHDLASRHPEWLGADGVHPNREGARQYAALVAGAIRSP